MTGASAAAGGEGILGACTGGKFEPSKVVVLPMGHLGLLEVWTNRKLGLVNLLEVQLDLM